MVKGMLDIQAIHFCDPDVMRLLVVQNPLPEILPGFLWITVVAAAIAARFPVHQNKLKCDIETVRSEVFAQDKAAAIFKQHQPPDDIRLIRVYLSPFKRKKPTAVWFLVKLRWASGRIS